MEERSDRFTAIEVVFIHLRVCGEVVISLKLERGGEGAWK